MVSHLNHRADTNELLTIPSLPRYIVVRVGCLPECKGLRETTDPRSRVLASSGSGGVTSRNLGLCRTL